MPGIMRMTCNRCDFVRESVQSITIVIKADGSEVTCGHPLERMIAEETTVVSWRQLVREGRIRYRHGMVCLGCGLLGYYGRDQLGQSPRRWTHWGNIVSSVTTREAGSHTCKGCGRRTLYPLLKDETQWEILQEFWNWVQGKPNGPVCPACQSGRLSSDMVAVT